METLFAPVEVFYSCAEADAPLLDQLEHHLSVLRHEGLIATWHKRQIVVGDNWQHELDHRLRTASLILVLISPDFLASDYLYGVELQQAMQRHHTNEARVIPVLLRPCDWIDTPFEHLQVVPRSHVALTQWRNRDAGFAEIAKEIRATLKTMHPLAVNAPSTTLPKTWQIPFARNPFFTGREQLLEQLHKQIQATQATAISQPQAISGLGGIGKTQLAIEYAYRHSQEYQAVFWARAETTEALNTSYTEIARLLNLPQQDAQEQEIIVQAVKAWLRGKGGWLLILDNVDDLNLVQPFLPTPFAGHLLLTTRAQVTGKLARRLEVNTLDREGGALLLLRRAGLVESNALFDAASPSDQLMALTEELGGLPLALDQAGAYIEETQCSLTSYQHQYQTRRVELLAHRGMLVDDHPEPVATTWSLSFAKVEAANPVAAELLRICAFLAPDAIPEELLVEALKTPLPASKETESEQEEGEGFSRLTSGSGDQPRLPEPATKEETIHEAVAILRAYSLVQRNTAQKTLSVHRLVQAVLREAMTRAERQAWVQQTLSAVREALPGIEFANWQQCEQYVPHAQECVQRVTESRGVEEAEVCHWLGAYLLERQRTQEAGQYVQQALRLREQLLGEEHLETAASSDRVARWWELQGKYAQAEPLYVRALAIYEQELGASHPDTASSLNNLALLYQNQGKYAQAEPLYVRALAICEQELGASHPDTASSLWWLAVLAERQQHDQEAKVLYQRALAIYKQAWGPEHPTTQDIQADYTAFLVSTNQNETTE